MRSPPSGKVGGEGGKIWMCDVMASATVDFLGIL